MAFALGVQDTVVDHRPSVSYWRAEAAGCGGLDRATLHSMLLGLYGLAGCVRCKCSRFPCDSGYRLLFFLRSGIKPNPQNLPDLFDRKAFAHSCLTALCGPGCLAFAAEQTASGCHGAAALWRCPASCPSQLETKCVSMRCKKEASHGKPTF